MDLPPRYSVVRSLGEGGHGEVVLARDRLSDDELVAVKLIAVRGAVARREFLTLAELSHPNIAGVIDCGVAPGGGFYFTSVYVAGGHLVEAAARVELSRRASWLLARAAEGLAALSYLHHRSISHGDVKPANLLVEGESDALRLIDFASARRFDRPFLASDDGTPAYRPQVAPGQESDPWIDLYGFGLSLFHAAVGRLPFVLGRPRAVEDWRARGVPARLRDALDDVPPTLDELVRRLTDPDPRERFRTARDALEFLRERIALPPRPVARLHHRLWLAGRSDAIAELADTVARGDRLPVVFSPLPDAARAMLEAIAAPLRVRGRRVVIARGFSDPEAEAELLRALRDAGEAEGLQGANERAGIYERCRRARVTILVDVTSEPAADPGGDRFADLIQQMKRRGGAFAAAIATRTPDSIAVALGVDPKAIVRVDIDPLSTREMDEAARRFFVAESLPEKLSAWLSTGATGSPAILLAMLAELERRNVCADAFGDLAVGELPDWKPEDSSFPVLETLSDNERRALGELILGGEPLSPDELAERFPHRARSQWQRSVARFVHLGLSSDDGDGRVRIVRSCVPPAEELLGARELTEARRSLARYFSDERRRVRFSSAIAALRNDVALGGPSGAGAGASCRAEERRLRRLAPRLIRRTEPRLLIELYDLMRSRFHGELTGGTPSPTSVALSLRIAAAYEACGRHGDALDMLDETNLAPTREGERFALAKKRAKLLIAAGRAPEAIEILCDESAHESSPEDAVSAARRLELASLAAPLLFREGRTTEGRDHLGRAAEFRSWFRRATPELRVLAGIRIAAQFAAAHSSHGDRALARSLLESVVAAAEGSAREGDAPAILNELGILHVRSLEWERAFAVFERLEREATSRGDRANALRATFNQAVAHYRLGRLDRAEECFHRARRFASDLGTHPLVATVWLGLGGVLRERGEFRAALRFYRRVLRAGTETRVDDRILAHNNIAELYLELGRLGRSREHSREAVRLARETESRRLLPLTICYEGVIEWVLGSSRGLELLSDALTRAREAADLRALGYCEYALGRALAGLDRPREAIPHLRRSGTFARRVRDALRLEQSRIELVRVLLTLGRTRSARRWLARTGGRTASTRTRLAGELIRARFDADVDPRALASRCRESARAGWRWEVLLALRVEVARSGAPELRVMLDTHVAHVRRSVPEERRASFDAAWWSDRADDESTGDDESHRGVRDALRELCAEHRPWSVAAAVVLRIESGSAVSVAAFPPSAQRSELRSCPEEVWRDLLASGGTGRSIWDRWLLRRIGGVEDDSVLALRAPGRGSPADLDAAVDWGVVVVRLAAALAAAEKELSARSQRLAEAEDHLRSLHAQVVSGNKEIGTEPIGTTPAVRTARLDLRTSTGGSRPRPLVGSSPDMKRVVDRIPALAESDLPVLIVGESGVGKDLLARWIHYASERREKPFVAGICNTPPSLLELELFGVARGAYTDAIEDRPGIFEAAAGGTIYLDEITDVDVVVQSKLLRVIEEAQVRRVGETTSRGVEFRLVTSSRQSRETLAAGGLVRPDLFYRLGGLVVEMPPLRARRGDIAEIAEAVLDELAETNRIRRPFLHPDALAVLESYHWPGNVRELENELLRLALHSPLEIAAEDVDHLCLRGQEPSPPLDVDEEVRPLREAKAAAEADGVRRALERYSGNVSAAARALDVTRRHLTTLIEKHGVDVDAYRGRDRRPARQKSPGARR